MYNFNHLYYFYVTAKSGGVTAASVRLRISQPSLSSQLKVLESALDLKLFQRVGRNNELTPAGSLVYGFCRQMFELSEQMGEMLDNRLPSAMRRIHIGVSNEVDRPFVADIVSLFLKQLGADQRPAVMVTSGTHEQLLSRLRFRELDVVISELAATDPDLETLSRTEVPVLLACSSNWKTRSRTGKLRAGAAIKDLTRLEEVQWVLPSSRFKLRSEIDRFFEANELKGRIVFESDVMASVVRSVIDEIGVAFLPLLYISRELQDKTLRILGPRGGYWRYRVWLTCHKQNQGDAALQSLSRAFKEVCEHA